MYVIIRFNHSCIGNDIKRVVTTNEIRVNLRSKPDPIVHTLPKKETYRYEINSLLAYKTK